MITRKKIFLYIFTSSLLCLYSQYSAFSSQITTETKKIKQIKGKVDAKKKEDPEEKKKEPIKINETEFEPVLIGKLLGNPQDFLNKKIKFRGKFSSFTTLALDYKDALRKSKDYISICIFRPDSKIPLSELKLAYPLKDAKENEVIKELEEGDLLEIYGQVFSTALDEPWVDIISFKKIQGAAKKEDKIAEDKTEGSVKAASTKKKK